MCECVYARVCVRVCMRVSDVRMVAHCNTLQHTATHCNTLQQVLSIDFHLDGLRFVSGGMDNAIKVWSLDQCAAAIQKVP